MFAEKNMYKYNLSISYDNIKQPKEAEDGVMFAVGIVHVAVIVRR